MSWFTRLRNAICPATLDRDLEEEMQAHLEHRIERLEEQGLTREAAELAAKRRFGNTTRLREESRDARLSGLLENILQDTRYALRLMRKNHGFTATIVVSLGLAIGANTAVFSILDVAMLRPLPVAAPEQLIAITAPGIQEPGADPQDDRESFSYPQLRRYREASQGSARLGLFSYIGHGDFQGYESDAPTEQASHQHISGDGFDILGVKPALGRLIGPEDDRTPGAHPVVVLGFKFWQERFHSDPAAIGRQVTVGGLRSTIIGVAREGFFGIEPGKIVSVWQPSMEYNSRALESVGWSWFQIIGRLSPEASIEQVQTRLQPAFHDFNAAMVKQYATMPQGIRQQFLDSKIHVRRAPNGMSRFRKSYETPLWILLGVSLAILAIACSNVASLLLARATSRASEVAMRVSLGAGRGRLIRQLLTESLLYALAAGLLGWLLARILAPLLVGALSTTTEQVDFVLPMNTAVLLFSIAVSLLAAIVFGLAPAWQASRSQPIQVMRASSGQAGKLRLGRFFVSIQVAFAFALVMLGAAFLFSLRNLTNVNMGFRAQGLTAFNIQMSAEKLTDETKMELVQQLRDRASAIPGVTATAAARWSIFTGSSWTEQVIIPGKTPGEREEIFYPVSEGYFKTMGTSLIAGRDFERTDYVKRDEISAIVNTAFASKYFPGVDPIGQHFRYPSAKSPYVIVGVAGNTHYGDLRHGSEPIAYFPFSGDGLGGGLDIWLYVRSSVPITFSSMEEAVCSIRPGTRVGRVFAIQTLVSDTILRERLLAVTGGALGGLGLILAAIGLYGLLNYSVERRTKEIGIRAALGARFGQIVGLVLRETLGLVALGLATGLAAAVFILASLDKLLFGIRAADPLVAVTACALFLTAALLAAGLPARRAAAVDPMSALRSE